MGLARLDLRLVGATVVIAAVAGLAHYAPLGGSLFVVSALVVSMLALALLAMLVGRSVEALGDRLGAGATGVVQNALGNLPELFVSLFALRSGLTNVATATIGGSILINVLLLLGLAFVFGGLRHGRQRFGGDAARTISMLLALSVAAMLVPSLTAALGSTEVGSQETKAALHERGLSVVVSIVLLGLFAASLPSTIKRHRGATEPDAGHAPAWPLTVALVMLAVTGAGTALVSDWFVAALEPATDMLGISQAFAGLVIVAIAGNVNIIGIQLALKNRADYALSVILQSPLQIALFVAPALVLLSPLVGAAFTLVLSPLLIVVLGIAVAINAMVVRDGESDWLKGATLVALYGIIAAAFWWG